MKKFFQNFIYFVYDLFNENKKQYILYGILFLFAIILGIYLSIIDLDFLDVLKAEDQFFFNSIKGETSFSHTLFSKIKDTFILCLLIFSFNLIYYTNYLNYLLFGYQSFLLGCTCTSLISFYGIMGVFLALIIFPINLLFLFIMMNFIAINYKRVSIAHRYNLPFGNSFNHTNYWLKLLLIIICFILLCFVYSVLFVTLLKSYIFSVY